MANLSLLATAHIGATLTNDVVQSALREARGRNDARLSIAAETAPGYSDGMIAATVLTGRRTLTVDISGGNGGDWRQSAPGGDWECIGTRGGMLSAQAEKEGE